MLLFYEALEAQPMRTREETAIIAITMLCYLFFSALILKVRETKKLFYINERVDSTTTTYGYVRSKTGIQLFHFFIFFSFLFGINKTIYRKRIGCKNSFIPRAAKTVWVGMSCFLIHIDSLSLSFSFALALNLSLTKKDDSSVFVRL